MKHIILTYSYNSVKQSRLTNLLKSDIAEDNNNVRLNNIVTNYTDLNSFFKITYFISAAKN